MISASGDPVIRGCIFADDAFRWSDLPIIIQLDRHDRASLERGAGEGLNEGITVPYVRLGDRMGSCTFAGMRRPERAPIYLGAAQMIGVFGFHAARRLLCGKPPIAANPVKLPPPPPATALLAGRLFDAHDRTELVVSAVLVGEIGHDELKPRQSE